MKFQFSNDISRLKYGKILSLGGMAERPKALVLKTSMEQSIVGSNPTPSADHPNRVVGTWGGAREADWARLLSECRG